MKLMFELGVLRYVHVINQAIVDFFIVNTFPCLREQLEF